MRIPILLAAFILALLLNCPLSAGDDFPLVTADGLHRVPDTRLRLVYADPDADLGVYSKLLLINPSVTFRKDWQRDINRDKPYNVTAQDTQNIRTKLAAMFKEILVSKLQAGGHVLVEEQGEDVLIVRPAILDLNISSPDTQRASSIRSIARSAGDMTLYLELRDSLTGDILAKALDHQMDLSNITTFLTDKKRNEKAARRILDEWAEILVNGLDETMQVTSGRQGPRE